MRKVKAKSVDYNSLIGSDFKNIAPNSSGARRRIPVSISITVAIVIALIVSVVLAQSKQSKIFDADHAKQNIPEIKPTSDVGNQSQFVSSDQFIVELELKPVTEQSQSQTLALRDEQNSQQDIISDEGIQHSEIIEPVKDANDVTVIIQKGDTLSSIFNELDIHSELTRILNLGKDAKRFKNIFPGQKLHFTFGTDGIDKLILEKTITKSLVLLKDNDSFVIEESEKELDKISQVATGRIDQSLFLAGQDAGMSDGLIMALASIFGWDIDFALDIRQGDSFTVMYEELYLDGEKVGDGNITAAEFINDDQTYRAYRYTDSQDKTQYYSPDGKSMRKPFIRTPVDLARISSHFNLRRKHPVLNKIRAHKGVDYAAATGTPIKATGDGKVIHRGRKGGYGNTIILRHGSTYTTLYAHMSKYARKTGVGSRVKQGQIIGYIGSTGLATGPHLHYEFRVNGVHRNPLKVKLPSAKPLPKSEMERFTASIQPLVAQLDAYTQSTVVLRDL